MMYTKEDMIILNNNVVLAAVEVYDMEKKWDTSPGGKLVDRQCWEMGLDLFWDRQEMGPGPPFF